MKPNLDAGGHVGQGPLTGTKVVELAGIGPGPYSCMLLADLGADVIRVARDGDGKSYDTLLRGRPSMAANLKDPTDLARVRALTDRADVLVEGFRPGVTERLGLGPDELLSRNPKLVYARMTGWGQDGPMAPRAGHDINYLSLTGGLHAIGEHGQRPVPPLNLVADFGGGALFCVVGVLAALLERGASGIGQVVDVAMVDGTSSLLAMTYSFLSAGTWLDDRGSNMLDGGKPFYATYECADGKYVAVGAIETQFFAALQETLGVDLGPQHDPANEAPMRELLVRTFKTQPRAHWEKLFADIDACVTPIRSMTEAPQDEHLAARGSLLHHDGITEPNVAPRFSRTPGQVGAQAKPAGALDTATLERWGIDPSAW